MNQKFQAALFLGTLRCSSHLCSRSNNCCVWSNVATCNSPPKTTTVNPFSTWNFISSAWLSWSSWLAAPFLFYWMTSNQHGCSRWEQRNLLLLLLDFWMTLQKYRLWISEHTDTALGLTPTLTKLIVTFKSYSSNIRPQIKQNPTRGWAQLPVQNRSETRLCNVLFIPQCMARIKRQQRTQQEASNGPRSLPWKIWLDFTDDTSLRSHIHKHPGEEWSTLSQWRTSRTEGQPKEDGNNGSQHRDKRNLLQWKPMAEQFTSPGNPEEQRMTSRPGCAKPGKQQSRWMTSTSHPRTVSAPSWNINRSQVLLTLL